MPDIRYRIPETGILYPAFCIFQPPLDPSFAPFIKSVKNYLDWLLSLKPLLVLHFRQSPLSFIENYLL